MQENDFDAVADERLVRELSGLSEGPPPPAALEDRVVRELRDRGLLERGASWPRRLLVAAAAVVLFGGGWLAGRGGSAVAPVSPPEPRFALFLLGGAEDGPDEVARVEEYRAWAVELARQGQLLAGEKLGPSAWRLDAAAGEPTPAALQEKSLSGFFLLTTDDPEEALAIARSCPHLRHGGEVLLRPIVPT